jgi:hypothetical protein
VRAELLVSCYRGAPSSDAAWRTRVWFAYPSCATVAHAARCHHSYCPVQQVLHDYAEWTLANHVQMMSTWLTTSKQRTGTEVSNLTDDYHNCGHFKSVGILFNCPCSVNNDVALNETTDVEAKFCGASR